MVVCGVCGERNPERARFCWNCGARLVDTERGPEERKIVTILFCDLVGFTAMSDNADPEDVKATLRPYHARMKQEIEHFGGTLDKFIGDGALGVFGAPVAHEDDPERAVRTALRIHDAIAEVNAADPWLGLAVRVGIATGEVVVSYGQGPQIGESVTGDVVNTASRLQGLAPPDGVVVERGDASGDAARLRIRSARAGDGQGQGRAPAHLAAGGGAEPLRGGGGHPRSPRRAVHRTGRGAVPPEGDLPTDDPRVLRPAGHDHRGARRREEPSDRGAVRVRRRAARRSSGGGSADACRTATA